MSMMAPKIIGEGSIAKRERKTVWRMAERSVGRWTLEEGTWKAKDRALSLISTHRRATSTFPTLGDGEGGEGGRGKWRGKKLGRGIKCITDKVERDVCEEEMEERKEGELTEKKEEREESKERKEREEREEWRRRRSERKSRKEMIGRRGGRVGGGRNGEEGGREDTKEREEERRVRIWEGRQGEE